MPNLDGSAQALARQVGTQPPKTCASSCLLTTFWQFLVHSGIKVLRVVRMAQGAEGFPRTAADNASMTMIFRTDSIAQDAVYTAVVCGSTVMGFID